MKIKSFREEFLKMQQLMLPLKFIISIKFMEMGISPLEITPFQLQKEKSLVFWDLMELESQLPSTSSLLQSQKPQEAFNSFRNK